MLPMRNNERMTEMRDNHYSTSDTALATYLLTEGFTLLDIDYSQPRYLFHFDGDPQTLREREHLYIAGRATVDPAVYSRVNKRLMRAIKNHLQWWGV